MGTWNSITKRIKTVLFGNYPEIGSSWVSSHGWVVTILAPTSVYKVGLWSVCYRIDLPARDAHIPSRVNCYELSPTGDLMLLREAPSCFLDHMTIRDFHRYFVKAQHHYMFRKLAETRVQFETDRAELVDRIQKQNALLAQGSALLLELTKEPDWGGIDNLLTKQTDLIKTQANMIKALSEVCGFDSGVED